MFMCERSWLRSSFKRDCCHSFDNVQIVSEQVTIAALFDSLAAAPIRNKLQCSVSFSQLSSTRTCMQYPLVNNYSLHS